MGVLGSTSRSELERAVGTGRELAELAAEAALTRLGVVDSSAPAYLSGDERELRRGLRARARQLGSDVTSGVPLLGAEVAYEQWHRILFARFLEANGLLMHPEFGASVTLEECGEFAAGLGEPDAWAVAARFASEILPGIFRLDDPSVRVRLAPEDLLALERVISGLPVETFLAEDSLGWVYQFWQSKQKKAVNDSGRKIGGADISPVTQLFTEDYMVRFLLENSLGAWWAGRHPHSPLLAGYEFLRFDENGAPAAGAFDGWPKRVAEVTVMDPCCGSGHFLVAAFGMLWRMRAEEEGLAPTAAQDAVLRENLFGLELDARCTQIAMFALALEAWKQGGYRELPVPNVACSGIPAKAPLAEWTKLAKGDYKLEAALTRLHGLFTDADTLGSLIDPVRSAEQVGLESVDWEGIAPLLAIALEGEARKSGDPAAEVFGHAAAGVARAAQLLSDRYTLVATNPPYLQRGRMAETTASFVDRNFREGRADLATAFLLRLRSMLTSEGTWAVVSPQSWLLTTNYVDFRHIVLESCELNFVARLGTGAFRQISGEVVNVALTIVSQLDQAEASGQLSGVLAQRVSGVQRKHAALREMDLQVVTQQSQRDNPDSRITLTVIDRKALIESRASGLQGMATADYPRFGRNFWERPLPHGDWEYQQSTVSRTQEYGGREHIVWWCRGEGALSRSSQARIQGLSALGNRGIAVSQMGELPATLYTGDFFDNNTAVILPTDQGELSALWAYCSSDEYSADVREIDDSMKVTNATLVKVPFDARRWRTVAAEQFPDGLPEPFSDDPTQWLFKGLAAGATEPLQVAVARLVGFQWPDQEPGALDTLADNDGIVCLPPVSGEQGAGERVRSLLATSYGADWSNTRMDELLIAAGGKPGDLDGWLRDSFFKHHTKVFQNRPFVWHIWDGRADGFSALINYHRLNRQILEKLTYTTLGWWIDRQRADARAELAGAAARLAAAEALRAKLVLILEGEPPYDIYVRWKSLAEQPIGWEPDLDDGVRMNIRPFVEAKILRSSFTINWKKDRGTNPDGSERYNDLHNTREEKQQAR